MKFYFLPSCFLMFLTVTSCEHEPPTPIKNLREVCFESEVLPIFQTQCAISGCHNSGTAQSGYVLDNYKHIMSNGIEPNKSSKSILYKVLSDKYGNIMPPTGPIDVNQRTLIRAWIDQGAQNNSICDTL